MSVWRTEVSIDSVGLFVPGAAAHPLFQPGYAGASYALVCVDVDPLAGNFPLAVKVNQVHDREINGPGGSNVYFTRMTAGDGGLGVTGDPYLSSPFDVTGQFFNDTYDSGALFSGGGVLAIEKDTDTGRVSFISPAGRWDTTTTVLGIAMRTPIRPLAIGLLLQAQDIPPDGSPPGTPGPAQTLEVKFSHFAGKQDGATFTGAAMSMADPGVWAAWAESAIFSGIFTQTFTQETSDEKAVVHLPADPFPTFGAIDDGWYLQWLGPDNPPPMDMGTDLAGMREHGILLGAYATPPMLTGVILRHSFDQGETWTDTYVVSDTDAHSSPSVQAFGGVVYVVYEDGTSNTLYQAHSRDFGLTWTGPMSVSITGTHPRLLVSPEGLFFYFYCNSGNLMLQRSDDFGDSTYGSPITVQTTVTAQNIGAIFSVDGSIVVSYIDGSNNWQSLRSRDLGLTWSVL